MRRCCGSDRTRITTADDQGCGATDSGRCVPEQCMCKCSNLSPRQIRFVVSAKHLSPARVGRPNPGVQRGWRTAVVCATDARKTPIKLHHWEDQTRVESKRVGLAVRSEAGQCFATRWCLKQCRDDRRAFKLFLARKRGREAANAE